MFTLKEKKNIYTYLTEIFSTGKKSVSRSVKWVQIKKFVYHRDVRFSVFLQTLISRIHLGIGMILRKCFVWLHYYFYISASRQHIGDFSKVALAGNPERGLEFFTRCVLWSRTWTFPCHSFFLSENQLKPAALSVGSPWEITKMITMHSSANPMLNNSVVCTYWLYSIFNQPEK